MSSFAKVVIAAVSIAMCICWTGCGGGSRPHPCQGATCVPSAGKFLYITALDDVSMFRVGAGGIPTGSQNQSGPNQSIGVAADPLGKFLYVSDFENATIVAFTINRSSGLLTPIGSPVSAGSPPDAGGLAVDPGGKFLYVTLMNSSAVAGFSIDPVSGALTPIPGASVPAGNTPVQAIVDSSGKFLYVSNLNDSLGAISGYSIDTTTGDLTPIPGSPFPTQAGYPGPAALRGHGRHGECEQHDLGIFDRSGYRGVEPAYRFTISGGTGSDSCGSRLRRQVSVQCKPLR
jgi:Lactonase, 7-bladed beta-propeller